MIRGLRLKEMITSIDLDMMYASNRHVVNMQQVHSTLVPVRPNPDISPCAVCGIYLMLYQMQEMELVIAVIRMKIIITCYWVS